MFWNDPHLYGATLPYKEIPQVPQTPFMGPVYPQWHNLPRFVPPIYGFNPYFRMQMPFNRFDWNVPRYDVPFYNQMQFKPWEMNIPRYDLPFYNQMQFKPWEMNIPQYDYFRPFI